MAKMAMPQGRMIGTQFEPHGIKIRQGAYLPHWTREGAIYAVTFRLADSLPKSVVQSWEFERLDIVRTGQFWQPEPYDHLIRDEDDFRRQVDYVLANPKRAGLKNWKWVGRSGV